MTTQVDARRANYYKLSSLLAQFDNQQLSTLFGESEHEPGWGRNHIITVGRKKVFVKRIPVTAREWANPFSTRNHYDLPLYYNYGVGSAGFGVYRELITHIKTSNWVLAGATPSFPLLYHYRIVPATGSHGGVDLAEHEGYVHYWNNDQNISTFILDRINASHEILLFLEYFPYTLGPWLVEHPVKTAAVLANLRAATAFLRKNGVIHFDLNYTNILTDGKKLYLTDFGLTLDKNFALSEAERVFWQAHLASYDDVAFLAGLPYVLREHFERLSDEQKAAIYHHLHIDEGREVWQVLPTLIEQVELLAARKLLSLPRVYVESLVTYRSLILAARQFYLAMRQNPQKDTPFPHQEVRRLLKASGFQG